MKFIKLISLLMSVLIACLAGANVAGASPSGWTPELTSTTTEAQNLTDRWVQSLGVSTPLWSRIESGSTACDGNIAYGIFYCPPRATVYITPSGISSWVALVGFAGAVYQTGHEATHHLQVLANSYVVSNVAVENQGYCGSGVFMKWLVRQGMIGDVIVRYFMDVMPQITIGDETHMPGPITAAFRIGYESGDLATCVPLGIALAGVPAK